MVMAEAKNDTCLIPAASDPRLFASDIENDCYALLSEQRPDHGLIPSRSRIGIITLVVT